MAGVAWWQAVRQFLNSATRRGRRSSRRVRRYRPWLDILEARLAPTVTLSISDPEPFPKPDTGQLMGLFVVTRSGEMAPAVQVDYATQDGGGFQGAHAGIDYLATAGTLYFLPNQATATITVPIIGNNIFQVDKKFTVHLSNPLPSAAFGPRQDFATGHFPTSVAVADFNGDGKLDLAVTNASDGTVSVLLNTTPAGATTPSFAPQRTFAVGTEPHGIVVGDFNGDGKPDLAVVNDLSDTVSVLLNTTAPGATTASFAPQQTFAVGIAPSTAVVGDFNGDGKPDLAVTNILSDTVSVLLNRTPAGATIASFAPQLPFVTGSYAQSVAVGDFNGDGKPDLAIANYHSNTISVLLNTTAAGATIASFGPRLSFAVGNEPRSVAVGDFNGDGRPDLAVANSDPNTVSVLVNTTPPGATIPSFALQQTFATTGSGRASLAVGDVNGDGKLDLAVVNDLSATVSVLLNTTAPGATTASFAPQQTFPTGIFPYGVAVADLNGDGKPDLAIAEQGPAAVAVLLNTRVPITVQPSFTGQGFATGIGDHGVAVGDFNGDGKRDLVIANAFGCSLGTISVLLNTTPPGATTPSFAPQATFAVGFCPVSVAVADFNGDGKPDIAVVNEEGGLAVLLNTTPPSATVPSFAPEQGFSTGGPPLSVAVGDFNGDNRPDIAVANAFNNSVVILLNTTPPGATIPTFAPQQTFATGNFPDSMVVGDFNGDGKPDLAVTNQESDTVGVLLNTTFPGATIPSFGLQQTFSVSNRPIAAAVGDFTGDGKLDLAIANYGSNTVSVLLNTTPAGAMIASFAPQQTFAVGNGPSSVVVGDFTSDGKPDLAVANYHANTVSVLINTTAPGAMTASFAPPQTFGGSPSPAAMAVGDFNGAGLPDLAIANYSANTVSVLLNSVIPITLTGSPATGIISSAPEAPVTVAAVEGTTPQAAVVGTAFDVPPAVEVRDATGHPVQGVSILFTAPRQGPSGTFDGRRSVAVFTDADGLATALSLIANTSAGRYRVKAEAVGGSDPFTKFHLVNTPAPAVAFQVLAPDSVASGTPFDVTVLAVDPYGNIDTNYTGTVHFSTSDGDPGVVLPDDYTFQPDDAGQVTFAGGVTLMTPGDQVLTVADVDSGIMGSATIAVTDGPGPGGPSNQAVQDRRRGDRAWAALAEAASLIHRRWVSGSVDDLVWSVPQFG